MQQEVFLLLPFPSKDIIMQIESARAGSQMSSINLTINAYRGVPNLVLPCYGIHVFKSASVCMQGVQLRVHPSACPRCAWHPMSNSPILSRLTKPVSSIQQIQQRLLNYALLFNGIFQPISLFFISICIYCPADEFCEPYGRKEEKLQASQLYGVRERKLVLWWNVWVIFFNIDCQILILRSIGCGLLIY